MNKSKKKTSPLNNNLEESNKTQPTLFNSIRFIISRFETDGNTSPSFYIVGFKIVCDLNQRESYVETMVNYNECKGKSDNEICLMAYNNLKSKIEEVSEDLTKRKFIIGSEFVPPKI